MSHVKSVLLLVVLALISFNAQADMSKEEVINLCIKHVNAKLPRPCSPQKQPAYCNSMGVGQGKNATYFFPYYAEAIRENLCVAQKQIMFNVCFNGNYTSHAKPFFSNWARFATTDMRCGSCHPSYAKTGWCY